MEKKLDDLLNYVQQLEKQKADLGYNDDLEEMIDGTERSLIEQLNNAGTGDEEEAIIGALNRLENLRLESGFAEEEDDFKEDDDLDLLYNDSDDDLDNDSRSSYGRDYEDD